MNNIFTVLVILVFIMVCAYVGLSSFSELKTANQSGCAFDENGTLCNCTQSDFTYRMQNQSANAAGMVYLGWGYGVYLIALILILTTLIFAARAAGFK